MADGSLYTVEVAASDSESEPSQLAPAAPRPSSGWLKVGAIAAVSGLAGGLAAAWWYRKTLKTLRQTGETDPNPHFGIPPDDQTN